jgi:hypothetical protein
MDEFGEKLAHEANEMVSEGAANASAELRKRRSTRIVQAVPLVVTGVDALGRPFMERTSTLIINCHGCRYQSKHYVLKNMWVTLEIPHAETGQPPRQVRGRVAWIQRPRTVRQLFQVALELETPGNVWGIAFPPDDWFNFPAPGQVASVAEAHEQAPQSQLPAAADIQVPLGEMDLPAAIGPDNLRVFPSPTSATDASLQLARQVTRLLAEAKQQIQAAVHEAAAQAVSAERRVAFEQWEQKFAAAREEIANEASRALDRIQQQSETRTHAAQSAAAEALRGELPRWLAPQLEQLTRELTSQLTREVTAQRMEHEQQVASAAEKLQASYQQAEETAGKLRAQAAQTEEQIATRVEAAARAIEETARQREETAGSQRESLSAAANEIQQQVGAALSAAQSSWHGQLAGEMEAAQARWQSTVDNALNAAQERAAGALQEQTQAQLFRLQEEGVRQTSAVRESLEAQAKRLEEILTRAKESSERLEHFAAGIESVQQQAIGGFQSQIEEVLSLHRKELHGRSDALFEDLHARIRSALEEANSQALERFEAQIESLVSPHVAKTEEAIHRLLGGRSLLDAAMTMQQDRIRTSADEAFADSLARFRENLGSVEQLLQESSQTITGRNLSELEVKASDLKHQAIEEMFKSAEWYEKKAQTQLQHVTEKMTEQAGLQLREKAGEVSSLFASELSHSSRNFVGHTQTQLEEVVRDSFERARLLFAEAADTTSAAFTDEIQRTARQELDGFAEEFQRAAGETRTQMEAARAELTQQVTTEQEEFLRRFQAAMNSAMEAGVADAHEKVQAEFAPLLDSWKSMTDTHQREMRSAYAKMSDQATEQYRGRLENVSNSWMVATVTTLDHQSRDVIAKIATAAEERLRETCAQVFAGIGDTLRERLQQIATGLSTPTQPPTR